MSLGFSIAFWMADLVMELNTILLVLFLSSPNSSAKCHDIASPSRSSSLASHMVSAFLAKSLSFFTKAFFSLSTVYFGLKSFSTSTPSSFEGRSAICPKLDSTWNSFPRNLSMVFAFAGDSTITKFFGMHLVLS